MVRKNALFIVACIFINLLIADIGAHVIQAESLDKVNSEIDQIEQDQQELQQERSQLDSEKAETQEKIDQNLNEQTIVNEEIEAIDQELNETLSQLSATENEIQIITNNIEEMENDIANLETEIERLAEEVEELQERIQKREDLLKERLVSLQQSGGKIKYIEVILGSQSFSDFISRSIAVTTIMTQDKSIMEEHKQDQEELRATKQEVEENKLALEDTKEEVEQEKLTLEQEKQTLVVLREQLDEQLIEKDRLMAQLQEEQQELEEYNLTLEEEQEMIAAQLSALEKAKQIAQEKKAKAEEEERKRLEQLNRSETNSNYIFIKPANGPVTSHYGWRIHPIDREQKFHGGTDIGGSRSSPIFAAADGVVATVVTGCVESSDRTLQRCGSGFGNHITISHHINGKNYVTLYAHLSSVNVSPGQVVNQGDVIGVMGSTGSSTGPHLHFEVHEGSYGSQNRRNPANYTNLH